MAGGIRDRANILVQRDSRQRDECPQAHGEL